MYTNKLIAEQLRQEAARLLRIAAEIDSDDEKKPQQLTCPKTGRILGEKKRKSV